MTQNEYNDLTEEALLEMAGAPKDDVSTRSKKPADVKPTPVQNRFTGVLAMHQEMIGEPAISVHVSFADLLGGRGEGWQRRIEVGAERIGLKELGCWVDNPGTVLIKNMAGEGYTENPTPEQKAGDKKKIIHTAFGATGKTIVRPKRFQVVELFNAEDFVLWLPDNPGATARALIVVVPK